MSTFEYIIVGAGTAGSVLAARLSENPRHRVLLIEAGAETHSRQISDPTAWPRLARTELDWDYSTLAQPGTDDAVHHWPRGKLLGGSSAINGMMHIRGDRSSYDAWEHTGAIGWNYQTMLPYLRRSETTTGRDPRFRGTTGPMRVGPAPDHDPLWDACYAAAAEAGHEPNDDSNAAHADGVDWNDMNVVDGARQSAADAYLTPIRTRANLTTVTNARVQRLIITGAQCDGVEYRTADTTVQAHAAREVILAAGTIGTPHLLLLSGIGPAEQLTKVGVNVAVDLPGVGANLHDHPMSEVAFSTARPVRPNRYTRKPHVLMRTDPSVDPDIQMIFIEAPVHPRWKPGPEDGFSVIVALMTPHSRGTLTLTSANPATPPAIDPAYLADPYDVERLVLGLRAARIIGAASALSYIHPHEMFPGAQLSADAALAGYLQRSVSTYFHPVGTCRIGVDPLAVVEPDLRVHGIGGLRVADASVMPSIVSGNTNAAVLGIAERAATLITEDRQSSKVAAAIS